MSTAPWSSAEVVGHAAAAAVAAAGLVAAWAGAAGAEQLDRQRPWAWVAVGAVAAAAAVGGRFVAAGRRRVVRRNAVLFVQVDRPAAARAAHHADPDAALVAVAGSSGRAHRPSCLLVARKATVPVPAGDDRPRCPVCADG